MALEVFYAFKLAPWFDIQPDLQYIVNPGGRYPDGIVGTLHARLSF